MSNGRQNTVGQRWEKSWKFDKNAQKMKRTNDEFRLLSKYMIKKYGKYIHEANPNVRWSM